jgi:AAA15 family ATPase/GTPase
MVVLKMGKNRKNLANKPKMCYHQLRKGGSSMLIEFRVANFKSFKDEIVFSMVADSNKELSETNLFQAGNMILLISAAVFGANASGKTNLIEAFDFFYRLFVPVIDTDEIFSNLPYFRLDEESEKKPVVFEISFFLGSERHRYGIEIDKDGIRAEWLYFVPKRQEACFYEREGDKIVRVGTYFDDKKALEYIKPDAKRPFLFTLAQDSVKNFVWAKNIFKYLSFYIRSSKVPVAFFKDMMEKELRKKSDKTIFTKDEIVSFLKKADMGITDISIEERKEEDEFSRSLAEFLKQEGFNLVRDECETYFHHPKYDKHNNKVGDERFPLDMESAGTAKFYAMLYPILHVLKNVRGK